MPTIPTRLRPLAKCFDRATPIIGGLGYDPSTDTLWAGGEDRSGFKVTHYSRTGTDLLHFSASVFGDGMEFIPAAVPEPGTFGLMALFLAGAALRFRKAKLNS